MGQAKLRRDNIDVVSVIVPERGRPEALDRLICSLLDTAGSDEKIEILVWIDTDDPAWVDRTPLEHSRTRYFRRPRPSTLGEKLNLLAAETRGGIIWFIANDQVVESGHWPSEFRNAIAALPNGIGVCYPRDPTHPDHASYPVISRRMYEALGFYAIEEPPYWFVDTAWDEWGILTDLKFEVSSVEIGSPDGRGKTHGMIDLEFWCRFFIETRPLRVRDAVHLLELAYPGDKDKQRLEELYSRAALCEQRTVHLLSPDFLKAWGGRSDSPPGPDYLKVKERAEYILEEVRAQMPRRRPKVAVCCPGSMWQGKTGAFISAMMSYSTAAGIDVSIFNIESSAVTHARNQTVLAALEHNIDAMFWIDSDMVQTESDILVRLLAHDKDIVGALYNKRLPDKGTGRYPTLGMLKGDRPDVMGDGLHEALLMPGGMLLVRTSVYRAMGFPYYFETYTWPGKDGLERFKSMAREYFSDVPPDDVLDELADTKFGQWIRTHYHLGEHHEDYPYFSEDYNWCRKARRHGYSLWVDLQATFQTEHIGTISVTCLPPEKEAIEAAEKPTMEFNLKVAAD